MTELAPNFPSLSDDDIRELVEQIRQADDRYAKMDAMEPYVEWGERRRLLWELTRTGALATWLDPELWTELSNGLAWATSADVVLLLAHIESYDSDNFSARRLIDEWPVSLDEMCCRAYADNPDPFDIDWREFPEPVRTGFQLVLRRFDQLAVEELSIDVLDALAKQHVEGDGLPMHVYLVRDGELTEVEIHDHSGPTDEFYDFIELFGDRRAWGEAVLAHTLAAEFGPSFGRAYDAWLVATTDQLVELLQQVDVQPSARSRFYNILLERRDDTPEELVEVARKLAAGESTAPGLADAEMCLVAAVLKWKRAGKPVPPDIVELFSFDSAGNPTKPEDFFGLDRLVEAVAYLPEEAITTHMRQMFEDTYHRADPFPVLQARTDNPEIVDAAFLAAETIAAKEYTKFSGMQPVAERWDRFLSFVDWESPETDDYHFGHYIREPLKIIFANMPEPRAERLLLDQLRADNDYWLRALEGAEHHPTEAIFEQLFDRIAREGIPATGGNFNWLDRFLRTLDKKDFPKVGRALADTDTPELHNSVKRVLGEERYKHFLEEYGGDSSADASDAKRVARLADQLFDEQPELTRTAIYFFDRTDEPPDNSTFNRIGGRPIGITDETWPRRDNQQAEPMEHILTLDLQTAPGLRQRVNPDVRAVSLFVFSPDYNEAWTPFSGDAAVVTLTDTDLSQGPFVGDLPAGEDEATGFDVKTVAVPKSTFDKPFEVPTDEPNPALEELRNTIYQTPARAGGSPIWLQGDESPGDDFLMQFDEQFVSMNLGDMGIMYVFAQTAFWQCH